MFMVDLVLAMKRTGFSLITIFSHGIRNTPSLVRGDLSSLALFSVSAGIDHSLFLASNGKLFSTGGGMAGFGGLGIGDGTDR